MGKSVITLVIFLFYSSLLISQDKEIINKYRPAENDLYKTLDQGIKSKSAKYIKLLYNEKGAYSYTQKKSFAGKGKTMIFELYGDNPDIRISIKNLSLSEFDKVIFNVFNISEIAIDSCSFINILNGVLFEFKENLNGKKKASSIVIKNSNFIDDDLNKNKSNYSDQLKFSRNKYAKGLALLKNVTIENCKFIMNDSSKSWQIKAAHNTYPKRHSINFFRKNNNVAFSNISINNNYFEAKAPYYRTEAITFVNDHNADFRTPKNLYEKNKKISIIKNRMITTSEDPGHGIFIQGPYQSVQVDYNNIDNYGMSIIEGNHIKCDGAIHLYGARKSKYSDDILNASITGNLIKSGNAVINVAGTRNTLIKDNKVEILPWSKFFDVKKNLVFPDRIGIRITTGDHSNFSKENQNVTVENNIINCNKEEACVGILMQSTKDFKIVGNKIIEPTNFGILIFGHENEEAIDIGNSKIENNMINFKDYSYKSLSTNFYKYDNMKFAAIKIYRMDNGQKYSKESLIIKDNKIIDKSNTIPKFSVVDKTNSNLKRNVKSDLNIED